MLLMLLLVLTLQLNGGTLLILSSEHATVIIQSANKVSLSTSLSQESSQSLPDRNEAAFLNFISLKPILQ